MQYCLVLEDNFAQIDPAVWSYEIQRGGFGTGSFEWTTNDPKNAYVDGAGLHIVPTLTTESTNITLDQLHDGYVLNLTTAGTCTSSDWTMCSIRSNKTAGHIVNPVRSARLSTKGKRSIRYGKVEVVAKMPVGNWLWPAIWMMPEHDVYGKWPRSGEIDIAESRGNFGDDYPDGRDSVISALHWGPLSEADAFWKTSGKHNVRRTDYSERFHTYGLEWSKDYLFTYIDSRLLVTPLVHPPSLSLTHRLFLSLALSPSLSLSLSLSLSPSLSLSLSLPANVRAASLLHKIQLKVQEHVVARQLWRVDLQQVGAVRSVVAHGAGQHAVRPGLLPDPKRGGRRHQRLLQERSWQQAVGRRERDGAQGVLGQPWAVAAHLGRGGHPRPDGAQRQDVE